MYGWLIYDNTSHRCFKKEKTLNYLSHNTCAHIESIQCTTPYFCANITQSVMAKGNSAATEHLFTLNDAHVLK